MDKLVVEASIEIDASPARVWTVLTSPAFTSRWSPLFGATGPIDSDWNSGSQVLWRNADGAVYVQGNVVAMRPEALLTFTCRSVDPKMMPLSGLTEDDITQTHTLSDSGGRTTLSIAHGDFSKLAGGADIYPRAREGWNGILARIKALAEE